ncbi:DUF349 domain-containing protein [Apibacter muscae]|uniref:DUF349 domain-containing protein n=1 Tax=Apibacter muscae TaxID=2509004 RepID=A0A563D8X2_9FLAO|nr:DUF349 domain-containing protein [Apibacter muscae]TWP26728.1 DUF349 domain-containing protein [Apibacter muscae]
MKKIMGTELDSLQNAEDNVSKDLNSNTSTNENLDNLNYVRESNNDKECTISEEEYETFPLEKLIEKFQELINKFPIHKIGEPVNIIKEIFLKKYEEEEKDRKEKFILAGGDELNYQPNTILKSRFNSIYNDYKTTLNSFYKDQEKIEQVNLDKRLEIIENLKDLYTQPIESIGTFFRKFKSIKEEWHNAGRISKLKAGDTFKTYFHHLENVHEFIRMNKELEELNYAHNLEQRNAIINRAKELVAEPSIQKALNELQYLHKLWKEQAEPVSEEFRESTWIEFKEITQIIHNRKSELFEKIKLEQESNLKVKLSIIKELETIISTDSNSLTFWNNSAKKIEELRENFFSTGRVPKENSTEIWQQFKKIIQEINHKKNIFYRNLKKVQQENLLKKNELLEIAKANKDIEDWETGLNLFKKIQEDWKKIGHVPRKNSDQIWKDFRENCNYFFERYKQRNIKVNEEWIENLEKKKLLLNELNELNHNSDSENILSKINEFSIKWNSIGKVPRENININSEFNQTVKSIIKKFDIEKNKVDEMFLNIKIEEYKNTNNSKQFDENLKSLKKEIQDLEQEVVQLENNLSFFSNAKTDNPLLKNVLGNINSKKDKIKELRLVYTKLLHTNPEDN